MKNKKIILIVSSCLLFVILVVAMMLKSQFSKTDRSEEVWSYYDEAILSIKMTMDEITISNENLYWSELRNFDIDDDLYKKALNGLVSDVRVCYMEFTRDGENYQLSNPILDYRSKKELADAELENLKEKMKANDACFARFYRYKNIKISEDEEKQERFVSEIEQIIRIKEEHLLIKETDALYDLLSRKYKEAATINQLSRWIKSEYNNYINRN